MTSPPRVVPVVTKTQLKAFIDLPWRIYQNDPNWVPPIKSDLAKLLTPGRHPFWEKAERALFLAYRNGEPVGRIAAILDHHYNTYHHALIGAWGFFECRRDPETALALFAAAENWVKEKGMNHFRGPLNPSINYEMGMLIQGFDMPPVLGFPHNPPYYHELAVQAGLSKEKDLLTYRFTNEFKPPRWLKDLAEKTYRSEEIVIRSADRSKLKSEVHLINAIYNECWADNWGSVPMTEAEIDQVVKEIIHFVDTDLTFFLYLKDEPVGVSLVLPDINPLLKRLDGRGGLMALIKKHLYWSEIIGLRGYILGIKKKYRQMGLPLAAYHHLMQILARKQYRYLEFGWNLEDNQAINQLYEEAGGHPYRRFRVYMKNL